MWRKYVFGVALSFGLILAACGGAGTPQMIGSYPQGSYISGQSTGTDGGAQPPTLWVTYNASLDMLVDNPRYALDSIRTTADQNGGYLLSSRVWQQGADDYAEATIAVPGSRFDAARSNIRALGEVRSESVSGDINPDGFNASQRFSTLTVTLRPASADWGRKFWPAAGALIMGMLGVLAFLIPPVLMLIGLITVIKAFLGWLRARRSTLL